ncbi:MAG: PocR ligand-binding domain-containing protein [Caldilineaceae bacterium]
MADLLTTRQVQEILKVDRTTIYRMVDSGQLPAVRVGKQWRFAQSDLDQLLNAAKIAPEPQAILNVEQPAVTTSPTRERQAQSAPWALPAEVSLRELLPLTAVQMIQDVFAEALAITIVVTDMAGHPITHVSNPCGLYYTVLSDDDAVARCIQDWQHFAGAISLEPKFSPNDLGLLCARGLIRVGNVLQGMVFIGGIAPDQWPPSQAQVAAMAAHFHVAPQLLLAHIDEVFHLDRAQRRHVLSLVQRMADMISLLLEDRSVLYNRLQMAEALLAAASSKT